VSVLDREHEILKDPEEKEYKHKYVIRAAFNIPIWPGCTDAKSSETERIHWKLRVISSDTLAITRDTEKEDKEAALKKSWEDAEPGRAEKAKKSRQFYLIQCKKDAGEELTEEELNILKRPRKRGLANNEPEDPKAKGKAPPPKGKAAPVEEAPVLDEKPREWPKSDDFTMIEIKQFFKHFQNNRFIHIPCSKFEA
jgi:hypothetical protein